MNKYQEALGILDANQTEFKDNRDITKRAEARLKLQELVDRATPRKVSKNLFGRLACDNCGISFQELGQQTYCKHCGQKIDWSEEDEF